MNEDTLTALEAEALTRCIASTGIPEWRPLLERQMAAARVRGRSEKTTGYYVDLGIPAALRMDRMPDEANRTPLETQAVHPDGENIIFFIAYVKDGVLHFLEASSTSDWPEDETHIRFLD